LNDKISVIIPTLTNHQNLVLLLQDVSTQSFKNIDLQIVRSVSPNGRARNIGAGNAKGNVLIFLDDDIRLGHNEVFANLIAPLKDESLGLTGTSQRIPLDSSPFQKNCANQLPRMECKITDRLTESDMVTTACCAIRREVFFQLGGFNEEIVRGVDPEFRNRLRKKGYKIAIVPNSWHYHPMPENLNSFLRMQFRNGYSSAFVFKFRPELLIETPSEHDAVFAAKRGLLFRIFRFITDTIHALVTLKFFLFTANITYRIGYVSGLLLARKN
jgi:GT2 family glycosyltransferase